MRDTLYGPTGAGSSQAGAGLQACGGTERADEGADEIIYIYTCMAGKLYKGDIQEILARRTGMADAEASEAVTQFFEHIVSALETDRYVKVRGLGIFKLIDVEARQSIDVTTGERIEIPGHKKVSFVVDPALKELVNRPFAHFETVELKDSEEVFEKLKKAFVEEGQTLEEEQPQEDVQPQEEVLPVEEVQPVETEQMADTVDAEDMEEKEDIEEAEKAEETEEVEEAEKAEKAENIEEPEGMAETVDTDEEAEPAGKAGRATLISRREELRELERQMALEEGKNRWAMGVIIILMLVVVLAGLLFLFAPEFLEQLFF